MFDLRLISYSVRTLFNYWSVRREYCWKKNASCDLRWHVLLMRGLLRLCMHGLAQICVNNARFSLSGENHVFLHKWNARIGSTGMNWNLIRNKSINKTNLWIVWERKKKLQVFNFVSKILERISDGSLYNIYEYTCGIIKRKLKHLLKMLWEQMLSQN